MKELHPLLPNLDDEIVLEMLKRAGASSVDDLFSDIPDRFLLKRGLRIGDESTESEIRKEIHERLSGDLTPPDALCFLGGGVWPHYVPAVVDSVVSRQEFYTSYTPYQPEISQGMLQALFEYQSLLCDLLGMGACNSSMYDWGTAAGEALRMAVRLTKRREFIVAESISPQRLAVMRTYVEPLGVKLRTLRFDRGSGEIDVDALKSALTPEVAGMYAENPNFFGVVEERIQECFGAVHDAGGICVAGVDPTSVSVLPSPDSYRSDVVVGEGQPLGISMNYGGPHIGIFAVRDTGLARSMPGRLIGVTTTRDGNDRAFCMVLQTREQHIRREAATSNICTNQALMGLAAACYLSLVGRQGFKRLGQVILENSHYAAERISRVAGLKAPLFSGPFFKEFVVGYGRRKEMQVYSRLAKRGIFGGYPVGQRFGIGQAGLYCVTEVHSSEDIARLAKELARP